jgi:nicotinamidase-related amidase
MIDKSKTAIIIIDVQKDFFKDREMRRDSYRLIKRINELTKIGERNKIPVIWIKQQFKDDLSDAYLGMRQNKIKVTIAGTSGSRLLSKLSVRDFDISIIKKRYSAFYNTGLNDLLKKLKVNNLIIAGVKTYSCVRMTVIDAYQRDYEVIIALDCLAKTKSLHDQISLEYLLKYIAVAKTNRDIKQLIG